MPQQAWVNNPTKYLRFRPGIKVGIVTDSLGSPRTDGGNGGWSTALRNYCAMIYGDAQPTWYNHGQGGVTMEDVQSDGQLAAAIADAPDAILVELGANDIIHASPQSRAYYAGQMGNIITTIRASLPTCMIAVIGTWAAITEVWNPDPNQATHNNINNGLQDACAQYNVQYVDVRSLYISDEMINNPTSTLDHGVNTWDGTHPNWRGLPMYSHWLVSSFFYDNPTYAPIGPTWNPMTDLGVTPTFWLEADQVAPGSVLNWGPFSKFATGTAPTCVAGGWWNGRPVVRFNGTSDVMTAALTMPTGPKTLFAVYKTRALPGVPGFWSLLTMTNGTWTTEFMPFLYLDPNSPTGYFPKQVYFGADLKDNSSDGTIYVGSQGLVDSLDTSGGLFPFSFCATFAGGSSTDTANYGYYWAGSPLTLVQTGGGVLAQPHLTALNALGARIADGVNPTNYAPLDLALLGVVPAVLSTVYRARLDEYIRRKYFA